MQLLSRVLMTHCWRSSSSIAGTWAGWVKGILSITVHLWPGASHAAPGRINLCIIPERDWTETASIPLMSCFSYRLNNNLALTYSLHWVSLKQHMHTTVKIVSCSSCASTLLIAPSEPLIRSLGKGAHCRSTSDMITSRKYQRETGRVCDGVVHVKFK